MPCPMPRLPPVTTATLPERSIFTPPHLERGTRNAEVGTVVCSAFPLPHSAFSWSRRLQEFLHLVRRPQRDDVGARHDALHQARQHVPRPDLDEARAVAGEGGGVAHAVDPTHRRRQLIGEQAAGACRVVHRLRRGVRDYGKAGIAKRRPVPAWCISSPRLRTSRAASGAVRPPAVTYAEYSPSE